MSTNKAPQQKKAPVIQINQEVLHNNLSDYGEFSFQVQDLRRSCGVLQRSIPVPFSTRGPSSAGCLSGTLPSSISHADRQSKSWCQTKVLVTPKTNENCPPLSCPGAPGQDRGGQSWHS